MEKIKRRICGNLFIAAKYALLTATMSFIGWLYEVLLMRIKFGEWTDRGFLFLPFCPIYGGTLLFVYFFMGTPKEKRGVLKKIQSPRVHTMLYLFFAFLIPTAAELFVGALFEKAFHIRLWSYAGVPLNFHGYIALPVSLLWSALIYMFMRFVFPYLKRMLFRLPNKVALSVGMFLATATALDFILHFYRI